MKTEIIRIKCGDGLVHLQPNGSHDPAQTLCYSVDDGDMCPMTPTNEKVSCDACDIEFEALRDGLKIVKI